MGPEEHIQLGFGFEGDPKLTARLFENGVESRKLGRVHRGEQVVQGVVPECRGHQKEIVRLVLNVPGGIHLPEAPVCVLPGLIPGVVDIRVMM